MRVSVRDGKYADMEAISPGVYRHSKSGREYEVIGIGRHSETLEELIVYRARYNSPEFGEHALWVRPAAMFCEEVMVDGNKVPRFVRVG